MLDIVDLIAVGVLSNLDRVFVFPSDRTAGCVPIGLGSFFSAGC